MELEYINTISERDYNRLRRLVGWKEIQTKQAQTGLNNTAFQIVAVDKGRTVGMARVISDGGYVRYIADVVVDPAYQGNQIGKTMLNKIMEYINNGIESGESVLVCLMAAKGKEPFYKKLEFQERPNDEFGAGMSQWISHNT
jgi:N-acetylglutamate synthase-like GNAT family acetyltransferase